jgi:hypothetical protein
VTELWRAKTKLAVSNSNGSHFPIYQDMFYKINVVGRLSHFCQFMAHAERFSCDVPRCRADQFSADLATVWLCKVVNIVGSGITCDSFIELNTAS